MWGYEEAVVAHLDVCWVESYGFDGYEELVWSGLGGRSGLDGERLVWGEGDGGAVGGHFGGCVGLLTEGGGIWMWEKSLVYC